VSGDPRIKCACDTVGWEGDPAEVAARQSLPKLGFRRTEVRSLPEEALGRGVNSPGTTVPARGRGWARMRSRPLVDEALT
jgi:hypothetical protein